MKKIVIFSAIVSFSIVNSVCSASVSVQNQVFQEKQYKKIEVTAIDKAAMDKINKSYGSYTVKEAYKAEDGEYKLKLSKDGVDTTATFTASGDLIKILS